MIVQIDYSAPLTLEEIIAFGKTPEDGNNHFDTFIQPAREGPVR